MKKLWNIAALDTRAMTWSTQIWAENSMEAKDVLIRHIADESRRGNRVLVAVIHDVDSCSQFSYKISETGRIEVIR